MKHIFGLCVLLLVFSCKNIEKDTVEIKEKKEYIMYEPSEMTVLMNQMYALNQKIKKDILAGNVPENFPEAVLKIHTAELSEFKTRDEDFKNFSNLFIETEKEIFNSSSDVPLEDRYNNMVNLCISCHQKECTGPIPRIKKLLIQ
ncbi:hypothetical protein MBM09_12580 [Flaviramulus sp. BrNp1-15]|uniref:hypothetical protein n=1 Tax=Flaviramulus sp. BrNp1-15 TaxID=2916754 RepID=UPI001EE95654|nr:hypothetical protein [Flaviramulus sp. BrNp1-15]ULC58744.1 hypothetical protein MBM09_12580 [Flaviramulus sp. BrNp1-15]